MVLVEKLAASTVDIEILFWVNSRHQSYLQVTSDVNQKIKEALQEAKIEMPTEIYTIKSLHPPENQAV